MRFICLLVFIFASIAAGQAMEPPFQRPLAGWADAASALTGAPLIPALPLTLLPWSQSTPATPAGDEEADPAADASGQEEVEYILKVVGGAIVTVFVLLLVLFFAIGAKPRRTRTRPTEPGNALFAPQKPAPRAQPPRSAISAVGDPISGRVPGDPEPLRAQTPTLVRPDHRHGMILRFSDPAMGEVIVDGDEVRIGRHSTDDVIVEDTAVSRQHVLISKNPHGRYEILNRQAERSAPNPVFVNGVETIRTEIKDGDVIQVGRGTTQFTFVERHTI